MQDAILRVASTEMNTQDEGEVIGMRMRFVKLMRKMKRQSGQSLVEYALILALIAVVALLVLKGVGTNVNTKLGSVNSNLQ
jgi:Flp pilus assembly pilin Flp